MYWLTQVPQFLSENTFREKWSDQFLTKTDINPKAFGNCDIVMLVFFLDFLSNQAHSIRAKIYFAVNGRDLIGWMDLGKLGIVLCPGTDTPISLGELTVHCISMSNSQELFVSDNVQCLSGPNTEVQNILDSHQSVFADAVGIVKGLNTVLD